MGKPRKFLSDGRLIPPLMRSVCGVRATREASPNWATHSRSRKPFPKMEYNEGQPKVYRIGDTYIEFCIIHAPTGNIYRATVDPTCSVNNSKGERQICWAVRRDGRSWSIPQYDVAAWANLDD
jgi:hypothetical protein